MKPRKAAVIFIFVTVTLDMLALGLIAPVLPKLVLNFLGGDATSAAKWFGVFGTVFALMQFFFSPVLGVLSDRFGAGDRSCFFPISDSVLIISSWPWRQPSAGFSLAASFLNYGREYFNRHGLHLRRGSSRTNEPARSVSSARLSGWGFILGPALGGLLGTSDPRLPFWVAGGLSLANALYGYFVLPESLPKDRRQNLPYAVLIRWAHSSCFARIRSCSSSRPSNSSATSRTKFLTFGHSTRFFVTLGKKDHRPVARRRWRLFGHNLGSGRTARPVARLANAGTFMSANFLAVSAWLSPGLARTGLVISFLFRS